MRPLTHGTRGEGRRHRVKKELAEMNSSPHPIPAASHEQIKYALRQPSD